MKIYRHLPDGTQIVEYEDSLAPALADMWNKSRGSWGGEMGVKTAEQVKGNHAGGAFFNVFVALKDGEAIGYCSFDRYYKDENTAYVHLLNVRPDYHGKKIGKELVLMCVRETIALGMPYLDIHTWPGNTKAVPLYKKCGFLWEDRADSTHLTNFIPTVLKTELLEDFFYQADWYEDSTRKIEIKPDGIKADKFEFLRYEWEKSGESLRVEFEKTGRRIRLIETNGFKIEMTAVSHELAFGLSYGCVFRIVNKTGGTLDIEINGKNNGLIEFGGGWKASVCDTAEYKAEFFVHQSREEQDPWRVHPCVLADIIVNGKHVEFGLGIKAKFPLAVSLIEKRLAAKPGMTEDTYINIKNALPDNAAVRFTLPENTLTRFEQSEYAIKLEKGKDFMIAAKALILACGYMTLPVNYGITLENGKQISFTHPLHLVNQGIEGSFAFENAEEYGAANGLWRLRLNKQDNNVSFDRIVPSGSAQFWISGLGKPYNDDFNLIKPNVRVFEKGAAIALEADFVSKRFEGAIMTEVYEMHASGILKRSHRITNSSQQVQGLYVKTDFWTNVGRRAVFHYDGAFHEIKDDLNFGFSDLYPEKIDENWMFDNTSATPTGVYWPARYKPHTQWGDGFRFEYPTGDLAPGESFETEPFVYMCGVFTNFMDFRDYVLGICEEAVPYTRNHLDIAVNNANPILSNENLALAVHNNRLKIWPGKITASSPEGLFPDEDQVNPDDEIRSENAFLMPVLPGKAGIHEVCFKLRFAGFESDAKRVLLIPNRHTNVLTGERDGILSIVNEGLCFSVSSGFADALYSLTYKQSEWLYSKYPEPAPYSWWNPFVGGIQTRIDNMGNSQILRERITADFAEASDIFGNVWTGIRADVTIDNFDDYKGVRYSQYYLTIPAIPVLCHFTKLVNGAGIYFNIDLCTQIFLSGKEGLSDIFVSLITDEKVGYRRRMGEEIRQVYDRLAVVTREGQCPGSEKLYIYRDAVRDKGQNTVEGDINSGRCETAAKAFAQPGGCYVTRPVFCLFTDKTLTPDSFTDFNRIHFT